MSDILVTGATGSLGSHLVADLAEESPRVRALVLPQMPVDNLPECVEVYRGDVADIESIRPAFDGVRTVYHLAGVAAPLNAFAHSMELVNAYGTWNVMSAAAGAGVERVVHTSSVSAIGWPDQLEPVDESFHYNGGNFAHAYMRTKRAGEDIALGFADRGMNVVVVNPSAVMAAHGHQRYGWVALVDAIKRGVVRFYPTGALSMTPAVDWVDGIKRAARYGSPGERYILASHHVTYGELFGLIADVVGQRRARLSLPRPAASIGCLLGSAVSRTRQEPSIFARENAPIFNRTMFYDQSKAERELGVGRTSLAEAIETVARTLH